MLDKILVIIIFDDEPYALKKFFDNIILFCRLNLKISPSAE